MYLVIYILNLNLHLLHFKNYMRELHCNSLYRHAVEFRLAAYVYCITSYRQAVLLLRKVGFPAVRS